MSVAVERKPLDVLAQVMYSCLSLHAAVYQGADVGAETVALWTGAADVDFMVENVLALFHQHVRIWLDIWKKRQGLAGGNYLAVPGAGVMFQAQMRVDGQSSVDVSIVDLCRLFSPQTSDVMTHRAWGRLDDEVRGPIVVALRLCACLLTWCGVSISVFSMYAPQTRPFVHSVRNDLKAWHRECSPTHF